MSKKCQSPKQTESKLVDQIIARARGMKPAARADFLRRHSASEIAEIHGVLVGESKPKTPRPILEKRILHALAEGTAAPQPAHLDQDMNILVADHHATIAAATSETAPAAAAAFEPAAEPTREDREIDVDDARDEDLAGLAPEPSTAETTTGSEATAAEDEPDTTDGASGSAAPSTSLEKEPQPTTRERDTRLPPVGTVIVKKDRHGTERVRCAIVEGGVEYGGTTYKSISSAALAAAKDLGLASKTQDGYAFWGLKKASARPATKSAIDTLEKAWSHYRERAAAIAKVATGEDRAKVNDALSQQAAALTAIAAEVA